MHKRGHNEDGFLMIELIASMLVLTIALLALIGSYSLGFFSIGSAAKTSSAGLLASNQLEQYSLLPYSSIGLDATTLTTVKASDTVYTSDEAGLPVPSGATATDVTISGCGASAQCSPVQTLTGADHKTYKVETFIRTLPNPNISSRLEKVVTVIVRNASVSGFPVVLKMQSAFDTGSPSSAPPVIPNCSAAGSNCESMLVDPFVVSKSEIDIVATDDQPIQTSGTYAPTAFLNSVQQLGLGTTDTSGWPQNYVTAYGGSASNKDQTLFKISLPEGLPAGSYTVLITCRDADGNPLDTDQWSWPISVAADGTVTSLYAG